MTSPHFALQAHTEELGCQSKTGQFHDGVLLDGEMGIKLGPILAVWCKDCEPSARLFNLTYVAVRHEFVGAMATLHLKDPSLYRLRHGGASHDRSSMTRTLDEVKKRGNLRSDKSVTRYEKAVRLQAIEFEASSLQLQFAHSHGLSMLDWISQPGKAKRPPLK